MWQDRTTVRKGNLGEQIVHTHLENKGYVVYNPNTEGPHAFDKLAIRNKQDIIIAECKTKARRNYYPDTGIDYRHFTEYKYIEERYNIPVYLFFVDEMLKKVYGNELSVLEEPRKVCFVRNGRQRVQQYPLTQNGIIYFPITVMEDIAPLTETDCSKLTTVSTRRYEYSVSATTDTSANIQQQ